MDFHQKIRGFTLVETAIVMIVVALLASGVLVGRHLIHAGQIRAVVRQIEQLDAGINAFRQKYGCLPGDCVTASDNGFSTIYYGGVSVNGDGDGLIRAANGESYQAVGELAEVALLVDVKTHPYCCSALYLALPPRNPAYDYPGIIDIDYFWPDASNASSISLEGHYYWMKGAPYLTAPGSINVLLPEDAYAIDHKIDDGFPRAGRVLATGREAVSTNSFGKFPAFDNTDTGAAGAASNYCVTNATPPQYNTPNTSRASGSLCTMTVQAGF